jgi:hypothetical protein
VKLFVRILLGGLVAWGVLAPAEIILEHLAPRWPAPRLWWRHSDPLVMHTSEAIVIASSVIVLGGLLSKIFDRRHAALCALASMALGLVAAYWSDVTGLRHFAAAVGETWGSFASFLLGPPLIVALLGQLRSNNRWRGP